MKIFKNLGILCLSLWLIATGAIPLLHLHFANEGTAMAVLAIAAGVLLLIGR
jgi:hypothetical protein